VKELIARAKANPGKLNYGAGIITTRLAGYLFNREAGLDVQYIPFNGSPPTVQGLLTGAVDYIVDGAATSLPLIQGGKLRALAKLNSRPLPALPEVKPLPLKPAFLHSTTSRRGSDLWRRPAPRAASSTRFNGKSSRCTPIP
jgi:hypothetical protein